MRALDDDTEQLLDDAKRLVRAESAGVAALGPQIDQRMVELSRRIIGCEGKVLIGGVGTSGETARRMAHLLPSPAISWPWDPHSSCRLGVTRWPC